MTDLEYTKLEASGHLDDIAKLFIQSAKLTLIVRIPDNDDADFLLTNDDLKETTKALERMRAKEQK